jgi:hypothetical protein
MESHVLGQETQILEADSGRVVHGLFDKLLPPCHRNAMTPFLTSYNHHPHFTAHLTESNEKGATACAVTPWFFWLGM